MADTVAALSAFVTRLLLGTGHRHVVLVGSSRGGNIIRAFVRNAGGAAVTVAAVLCGTPCRGILHFEDKYARFEFNGASRFLKDLNEPFRYTELLIGSSWSLACCPVLNWSVE